MSFWKSLGKIGLIGGGAVLTGMTGGAASPLLAAAIGAGTGAGVGAIDGGWKGALKGAAGGAVTGGLGGGAIGGAASGAKMTIAEAAKAALKNKDLWMNAGSAIASGVAGGQQKGREADNAASAATANFKSNEAQSKEQSLQNRAALDLRQRQFTQDTQGDAYKKAMLSALAMNMQDAHMARPAGIPDFHMSGGLRPSGMGLEGKAAAGELNKQAMLKLMTGEKFDPLPAYQGTAAPEYKKPGALENISGILGMAGNAVNSAKGEAENRSFQEKLMAAIEALNQPAPSVTPPTVPGGGLPQVPKPFQQPAPQMPQY